VSLARFALWASALAFGGTGLAFLLRPETMAAVIAIDLRGTVSRADVRAVYGGLELGVAAFLLWAERRPAAVRPALVALVALFGGLLLGRAASLALDGWPESPGALLAGLELVGLALAATALAREPHPTS
jgi:hypothetical protein